MSELQPKEVWSYFEEILEIPRLSRHEEKIIGYVSDFADEHQLEFKQDAAGNCLVSKPATPGFEDRQTVILQSHLDMVGEKLKEVDHDFFKDPIRVVISDGWMTAEGTTLGADDGIGVAASLAILASDEIPHGPLECLFTVDEETGMTGAHGLQEGFMRGTILMNLDSEDEGEIFIGCAGGIDTVGLIQKKTKSVAPGRVALHFSVDGLQGGHSGDEIHKGFGNAIKIMNRFLWNLDRRIKFHLAAFEGGKLRNAIPREATAVIVLKKDLAGAVEEYFGDFLDMLTHEIAAVEPAFSMEIKRVPLPEYQFKRGFQRRLMNMLYALPHGVIAWSRELEGLVETSTNLAVLRDNGHEQLEIVTSQRSSSDTAKGDIADRIAAVMNLAGCEYRHSDGYPGWKPDRNSAVLRLSEVTYKKLFNQEPDIKAIHAGLECGLFLEKYPQLDMISFGPTIKGAHTPDEKLHIESVSKFWDFLLEMLRQVPEKE